MPLSSMAEMMLIIAALTGLMPKMLDGIARGELKLAVLLLAPLALGQFDVRVSQEFTLNAASALYALSATVMIAKYGARASRTSLLFFVVAVLQFGALNLLSGDAALLAAGLAAVILAVYKMPIKEAFAVAALAPLAAALAEFLIMNAVRGYGVLEISKRVHDVQALGALFIAFAAELAHFNAKKAGETGA